MKFLKLENNDELQANLFSFAIHLALFLVMVFSVGWQTKTPYYGEVELWDTVPVQKKINKIQVSPKKKIKQKQNAKAQKSAEAKAKAKAQKEADIKLKKKKAAEKRAAEKKEKNSIVHSFNRNFAKRADGNPNTHAFVTSPEMVMAVALSGNLDFNPLTDKLTSEDGQQVFLDPPVGDELPSNGFAFEDNGYVEPPLDGSDIEININPESKRLQVLEPFSPWNGENINNAKLLIKAHGKCTTDHISMAGPWLRFRGHLDNISDNCLIGAVNHYNMETNKVKNLITGEYGPVPETQRF